MRKLCAVLLILTGCSSVGKAPSIHEELADVQAELTGEVKKLRNALAALLSAQAWGGNPQAGSKSDTVQIRTAEERLCWVLGSVDVEGKKMPVLCLYQADGGRRIKLQSVRVLGWDFRIVDFHSHPSVREVRKMVEKGK